MRVDTLIDQVVAKFIGTKHERDLKQIQPLVTAINAFATEFEKLTDAEILEKTVQLKAQVQGRLGDLPLDDADFKERCKDGTGTRAGSGLRSGAGSGPPKARDAPF